MPLINLKIVTNNHNLYAIRKGIWPFHFYFDLKTPRYWWSRGSTFYTDCFGDLEEVKQWYGILKPQVLNIHTGEEKKVRSIYEKAQAWIRETI